MPLNLYFFILTCLTSYGNTNMAASMTTKEILLSSNAQCDRAGFCPKVECGISEIKVTLLVSELQAMNVDVDNIHLIDKRCWGFPNINGILYISMTRDEGACGTVLTKSETYATYKNTIFLPPDPAAIIYRELLNINVVCTYPLDQIPTSL
ncbi:uromodulin-like [Anomaloglossus baeobatrachus]|uniref:uromodulin-like n=1 Tax=Anomaloglossus baeobatrachus TaxID=238106 RepID=UPI003F505E73